jgi:hypothetical protein
MECRLVHHFKVNDSFWKNSEGHIVEYVAVHYICPELFPRADIAAYKGWWKVCCPDFVQRFNF